MVLHLNKGLGDLVNHIRGLKKHRMVEQHRLLCSSIAMFKSSNTTTAPLASSRETAKSFINRHAFGLESG